MPSLAARYRPELESVLQVAMDKRDGTIKTEESLSLLKMQYMAIGANFLYCGRLCCSDLWRRWRLHAKVHEPKYPATQKSRCVTIAMSPLPKW